MYEKDYGPGARGLQGGLHSFWVLHSQVPCISKSPHSKKFWLIFLQYLVISTEKPRVAFFFIGTPNEETWQIHRTFLILFASVFFLILKYFKFDFEYSKKK